MSTEGKKPPASDRLGIMMMQQLTMQRDNFGIDYLALTDEEKIRHFKEMYVALVDEMHEALGEMGWKPWATSKHFDTEAVQAELVDAWHFFMNLMLISGMTPEDLMTGYQRKRLKNIARQEVGYDGVATKCKGCKRAFDDDAVKCHPSTVHPNGSCCHYNNLDGALFV